MPAFNDQVLDPDEEVLNISRNILDDEEPKFYPQPKADLKPIYGILLTRRK
jgi:hypothetical protein